MYNQRPSFGFGGALTPAVKNLLFANGIIFLMQFMNYSLNVFLTQNFALHPYDVFFSFKIWQLVSYMFLHGGFWHLFFNMFIFWMFGSELEKEWGTREFVKYYFICGIGAGITILFLSSPASVTIGASGAVYGIMVAYALKYPNRPIYIYFLFPVKVKYFIGFLAFVSFFSTIGPNTDGIAHAAHLGGMVIGFIYLKYWDQFYKLKTWFKNQNKSEQKFKYYKADDDKVEYYRKTIDELLDKINRVGYLKLTDEEKELLEEGSKYLREHDKENYN